jgi:hypothetical protein
MRRLVVLITAVAALAFAPSAGAYVQNSFFNGGSVTGSGTFGSNSFTLFINQNPIFGGLNGIVSFGGTDANGTHSFGARVTCLDLSSDGANATILGEIISAPAPVGEPANLAGVLVHATDPEPANQTTGTGDKLDVTFLNAKQYQRQLAAGCPAAAAKTPIHSGNLVDIIDVFNIPV